VTSLVVIAQQVAACAVCGSSKSPNDAAFGVTTLILSLLPPVMFGIGLFFVIRAHKKAANSENIAPPAE
jgi:hypothetical protein